MKFLTIFIAVIMGLTLLEHGSSITKIKEELKSSNIRMEFLKENIQISLRLLKNSYWYVVDENKVSSLPNGQGEIVNLSDRSLLSMGNRLDIKRPVPNTKIRFSPIESPGQAYTVAGELLKYEYLDN